MRDFVRLRELVSNKELAGKLSELERKLKGDQAIAGILDAIRESMAPRPIRRSGRSAS